MSLIELNSSLALFVTSWIARARHSICHCGVVKALTCFMSSVIPPCSKSIFSAPVSFLSHVQNIRVNSQFQFYLEEDSCTTWLVENGLFSFASYNKFDMDEANSKLS